MKTYKKTFAMLALAATMFTACGPFVDIDNPSRTVEVTGITIVGDGLDGGAGALAVGQALQLSVTYTPLNTDQTDVAFVSSDDAVATVTVDGLVTAVGPGTVTITVTSVDNASVNETVTLTVADELIGVGDAIDQSEAEARRR